MRGEILMFASRLSKPLVLGPLFTTLALTTGCGGGSSGPLRVFATGDPITASDYQGRTFPLLFILGQDDEAGAVIKGGEGRITISNDGNTVKIKIPGEDTLTFTWVDGNLYEGIGLDGEIITVTVTGGNNGEYVVASCGCGEFEGFDYASAFGLETPRSRRPADTATYTGAFSGLIIAAEGDPEYLLIPGGGSGELTANFADASISGTLIDASTSVALDEDDIANDAVGATLTMDGSITSTGFDGTVDGEIFFSIDEGEFFEVPTTFSNTDVDGKFFGYSGETAAATYDGDVLIDFVDPEIDDVNASFEGIFVGSDPTLGPVD